MKLLSHVLYLAIAISFTPYNHVQAAWLNGFACRRQITIDHTKIDADLTNFPVLVRLTTNNFDFADALTNGLDVRFADADTESLLKFERERHDAGVESAEYWVKIPKIKNNAPTVFYLYYNNPGAVDGAMPAEVWGADFAAVWHKGDLTASSIADSTANGHTGVKRTDDAPAEAAGKIARAQDYVGAQTNYVDTGLTNSLTSNSNFTVSVWLKYSGSQTYAIGQGRTFPPSAYSSDWFFPYGVSSIFWMRSQTLGSPATINNGAWHHVALVWDMSVQRYTGYVDGNSIGISAVVAGYGGQQSVKIGARPDLKDTFFTGAIDEVRISLVDRSAAWVKAEYHAGNDSLLACGAEQPVPPLGLIMLVR